MQSSSGLITIVVMTLFSFNREYIVDERCKGRRLIKASLSIDTATPLIRSRILLGQLKVFILGLYQRLTSLGLCVCVYVCHFMALQQL